MPISLHSPTFLGMPRVSLTVTFWVGVVSIGAALAGCTAPGAGRFVAGKIEDPWARVARTPICPILTEHAAAVIAADDPQLVDRASLLVEIVRIETEALRSRLNEADLVDAVTLAEINRLISGAASVERALRGREQPRYSRTLADETTHLRSRWNAFQMRQARLARG